jgi:reductive dehalogenase
LGQKTIQHVGIFTIFAITKMVLGSQGVTMAKLGYERRVLAPGDEPASPKRASVIDETSMDRLKKALLPYEKQLQRQEKLRKWLGVREVDQPTYQRYITGPIERFEKTKMAFLCMRPDNPYGEELRKKFKDQTGYDHYLSPLPYKELDYEDRIARSMADASYRACSDYDPEPFPMTVPEGRLQVKDRAWMSRLIKKLGLMFGADIVGITELDPRWVYKDVDISHKYAIVAAVQHKRSLHNLAPSYFSWASTADSYSRLKLITTQLTDFIRGLGYDAMYRETRGGGDPELNMVPLALDAGIGEFCRTGRVLSPEYGNNMRLKAITTDLPLRPDKPISFGAHEFCLACENCAKFCPPGAVPKGEPSDQRPNPLHNNPGFRKWWINAEKCIIFWGMNKRKWPSCGGRCIAVCPWNKPINGFHNAVRWLAIRAPSLIKKLLVWGDEITYQRKKKIHH